MKDLVSFKRGNNLSFLSFFGGREIGQLSAFCYLHLDYFAALYLCVFYLYDRRFSFRMLFYAHSTYPKSCYIMINRNDFVNVSKAGTFCKPGKVVVGCIVLYVFSGLCPFQILTRTPACLRFR